MTNRFSGNVGRLAAGATSTAAAILQPWHNRWVPHDER
jgi:hypothetical protein